jgi:hypothetical protein
MRMNVFQPVSQRFPAWADWTALIFLAFAAPLIAACIQSICVIRGDHWIYQAVIGGAYFRHVEKPGLHTIFFSFGSCAINGAFTLPALAPFQKRTLCRWLVWLGAIAFWTLLYFTTAIELK